MGHVLQAGAGQITARQAAVKGGIPMTVPALTINKVCLSGLDAIALADQLIRAGEFEIVVAGGMESMTNAPHLLPKAREGYRYGNAEIVDAMAYDGALRRVRPSGRWARPPSGATPAKDMTREEQDEFAARSPRAGRRGHQGRPLRRRDRPGRDPAAQGRPGGRQRGRGRPRPAPPPRPSPAAAGVRQGRHASPPATPRRSPTAPPRSS